MVDFLIIGPICVVKYKDIFPLFKDGDISFGWNRVVEFDGGLKFGNIRWFSNISDYCPPPLVLSRKYVEGEYRKYDNIDFINIDMTRDIPGDYDGVMGVPFSFIEKWNIEQFELVGMLCELKGDYFYNGEETYIDDHHKRYTGPVIDGKALINRLLIKRKDIKKN